MSFNLPDGCTLRDIDEAAGDRYDDDFDDEDDWEYEEE